MMTPQKRFDSVSRTSVIRSEKPGKPLQVLEAKSEHQANRVIGLSHAGEPIVVAHRPGGKGGVSFNKLVGGRVFAVAADAITPILEKDENKQRTKVQKLEDGLKAFSSSGFYILSSKEYPAEDVLPGYVRFLDADGTHVLLLKSEAVKAPSVLTLRSDIDLDLLEQSIEDLLQDKNNILQAYVASGNRARKRAIDLATLEAQDQGEDYTGVPYKELGLSPRDGTPFAQLVFTEQGRRHELLVVRQTFKTENGKTTIGLRSPEEALRALQATPGYARLRSLVLAGEAVTAEITAGSVLRSSVVFKGKAQKEQASPSKYGDGPFLRGMRQGWVRAFVTLMFSRHPALPLKDYESLHFVCSARQAEMGFSKVNGKTLPPEPIIYLP